MRKAFAAALLCAALAGCESYGDLTSDAFDPGMVSQSQFTLDAADCAARAEYPRDYQLPGITESNDIRHQLYNRAYTACMTTRGYARRDWSPGIPVPYTMDLRP